MNYVIKKGSSSELIFTFHGTGGEADQLFELATRLNGQATLIGLEGRVLEGSMRRYFKRYPDGQFDLKSLEKETVEVIKTILSLIPSEDTKLTFIGYSNGANILVNLLKEVQLPPATYLLLHPSEVRPNVPVKAQPLSRVALTFGEKDPFIKSEAFDKMVDLFKENIEEVQAIKHQSGHQLSTEEWADIEQFYHKK